MEGANGGWRKGAALAEGKYMTIDQDRAVVHIEAPQDKEISKLSLEINATYITYGARGKEGAMQQIAQDNNAIAAAPAGAAVQRERDAPEEEHGEAQQGHLHRGDAHSFHAAPMSKVRASPESCGFPGWTTCQGGGAGPNRESGFALGVYGR